MKQKSTLREIVTGLVFAAPMCAAIWYFADKAYVEPRPRPAQETIEVKMHGNGITYRVYNFKNQGSDVSFHDDKTDGQLNSVYERKADGDLWEHQKPKHQGWSNGTWSADFGVWDDEFKRIRKTYFGPKSKE